MKKCAPLNGCGCHFLPLTGWVRPNGSDVSQRRLFESAAQGCPNASRQRQGIGLLPEGIARRRARSGTCPPLPLVSASGAIPLAVFPSPLFFDKNNPGSTGNHAGFFPAQSDASCRWQTCARAPADPPPRQAGAPSKTGHRSDSSTMRPDRQSSLLTSLLFAAQPRHEHLPNQGRTTFPIGILQ